MHKRTPSCGRILKFKVGDGTTRLSLSRPVPISNLFHLSCQLFDSTACHMTTFRFDIPFLRKLYIFTWDDSLPLYVSLLRCRSHCIGYWVRTPHGVIAFNHSLTQSFIHSFGFAILRTRGFNLTECCYLHTCRALSHITSEVPISSRTC